MDCPVCPKRDIEDGQLYCPNCKTDLTPLLRTKELPLLLFNQALTHLQRPKANADQVESQLLLSIQLCPRLVEPRVVLGKLYAQQRRYVAALAQLWLAQKIDSTNKEVQQCISVIVKMLYWGDARKMCLEADYGGKPVYLWSTLQFLDGNKSFAWRLISNKTEELSQIVLGIGRIFPRLVILSREQIKEVDRETVLVNLRWREVKSLTRYHSDTILTQAIKSIGKLGTRAVGGINRLRPHPSPRRHRNSTRNK